MSENQQAAAQLKWVKGTELTAHDWHLLLETSRSYRFTTLGQGLEYGLATGRLNFWTRVGYDQVLVDTEYNRLSNETVRAKFLEAADLMSENTIAAAVKALLAAWYS